MPASARSSQLRRRTHTLTTKNNTNNNKNNNNANNSSFFFLLSQIKASLFRVASASASSSSAVASSYASIPRQFSRSFLYEGNHTSAGMLVRQRRLSMLSLSSSSLPLSVVAQQSPYGSLICIQRRCMSIRNASNSANNAKNTSKSSPSSSSSLDPLPHHHHDNVQDRANDGTETSNRQSSRFSRQKARNLNADKKVPMKRELRARNFQSKLQKQKQKRNHNHRFASSAVSVTAGPLRAEGSNGTNPSRHRHSNASKREFQKRKDEHGTSKSRENAQKQNHSQKHRMKDAAREEHRSRNAFQSNFDPTVQRAVKMVSSSAFARFTRQNMFALPDYEEQMNACGQMLQQSNVLAALCLVAPKLESSKEQEEQQQQHSLVYVRGMRIRQEKDLRQTESIENVTSNSTSMWESFNLQPTVLYAAPIRFPSIPPPQPPARDDTGASSTQLASTNGSSLDVVDWRSAHRFHQQWAETVVDRSSREVLNAFFGTVPLGQLVSLAHALAHIIQSNHESIWRLKVTNSNDNTLNSSKETFPSVRWFEKRWENERKKRLCDEASETRRGDSNSPEYLRFLEEELKKGTSDLFASAPHVDSTPIHSDECSANAPTDGTTHPYATVSAIEITFNLIARHLLLNWFSVPRERLNGLDRLFLYPFFSGYEPRADPRSGNKEEEEEGKLSCIPPNPTNDQKVACWRQCVVHAVETDAASAAAFWKLMAVFHAYEKAEIPCDEWLNWFSYAGQYLSTPPTSVIAVELLLAELSSGSQPTYASVAMRNFSMHTSKRYAANTLNNQNETSNEALPIWSHYSEMFYPPEPASTQEGRHGAAPLPDAPSSNPSLPVRATNETSKNTVFTPLTRRILEATVHRQLFGRWLLNVYVDVLERSLLGESPVSGAQQESRKVESVRVLRVEKLSRSTTERRKVPGIIRKMVGYDESYTLLWHFLAITQPDGFGSIVNLGIPKPYELTRSFVLSLSAGSTALWTSTDSGSKSTVLITRRALTCSLIGEMLSAAANPARVDGTPNSSGANATQSAGAVDYLHLPCPSTTAFLCTSSSLPVLTVKSLKESDEPGVLESRFEWLVRDALQAININAQLKQVLTRFTAAKHPIDSEGITADTIAAHTFSLLEAGILSSLLAADQRLSTNVTATAAAAGASGGGDETPSSAGVRSGLALAAVKMKTLSRIASAFQDTFRDALVSRITSMSFRPSESDSDVIRTAVRALYDAFRAIGSFKLDDNTQSAMDQVAQNPWVEFRRALSLFFTEENESFIFQKLRSLDQIGELQKSIKPVDDPVLSQLRVAVSVSRHSDAEVLPTLEDVLREVDGVYSSKLKSQNTGEEEQKDPSATPLPSSARSVAAQSWTVAELEVVVAAVYLSFTRSATHPRLTTVLHHRTPATSLQFHKRMAKTVQALATYRKLSSSALVAGGGEAGASAVRHMINSRNVVFIPLAVQSIDPEAIFSVTPLERSLSINCAASVSKFALTSLLEAVLLGLLPVDALGQKYRELVDEVKHDHSTAGGTDEPLQTVREFLSPISGNHSLTSSHLRSVAARVAVSHLPPLLSDSSELLLGERTNGKARVADSQSGESVGRNDTARFLLLVVDALVLAELHALPGTQGDISSSGAPEKNGIGSPIAGTSTPSPLQHQQQKLSPSQLQDELLRAHTLALDIHITGSQVSEFLNASRTQQERRLLLGIFLTIVEGIQGHPGACSVADSLCLWVAVSARSCGVVFTPRRRLTWPATSLPNHLPRPPALSAGTLDSEASPSSPDTLASTLQEHVYYAVSRCVTLIQSELTSAAQLPRPAFIACVCAALHAISTLGIDIDAEGARVESLLARGVSGRRTGTKDIGLLLNSLPATSYSLSAFLPVAAFLRLMRHDLGIHEMDRALIALNIVADSWDSQGGANRLRASGRMCHSQQSLPPLPSTRGHSSDGVRAPNADGASETVSAKLPSSTGADDVDGPSFIAQPPAMRAAPIQLRHAWATIARRMIDEAPGTVPTQTLVNAVGCGSRMGALDGSLFFQIFSYVCETRSHELDIIMWTAMLTSINESKISSISFTRPQSMCRAIRPRIVGVWEGIREVLQNPQKTHASASGEQTSPTEKQKRKSKKKKNSKNSLSSAPASQPEASPAAQLHRNDRMLLVPSATCGGDSLSLRNPSLVLCPFVEVQAELFPADEELWALVAMCVESIVARRVQEESVDGEEKRDDNRRIIQQNYEDSLNLLMSLEWSLRTAGFHSIADRIVSKSKEVKSTVSDGLCNQY